jgi:hypothetical protein
MFVSGKVHLAYSDIREAGFDLKAATLISSSRAAKIVGESNSE